MFRYIVRRALQSVVLLFIVSIVTFVLIHSAPGGPALLANPDLTREEVESITQELGLDDPIPVQYVRWLGNVLSGDLGTSHNTVEPVGDLILSRLPNTLMLTGVALGAQQFEGIHTDLLGNTVYSARANDSTLLHGAKFGLELTF